ncbi:Putative Methyltransferase domain-containing protein [Aspergillus calidoustus]|uniref:Putative Methyltransferase domain-containing protein n=1 Tax=Aspergillus calidoustus TaxID=454130 RepID=A0A0U5G8L9_ASPCI|nr:Putative Methyltransferase domain-containing protein [Aspergillus calidoustus]
MSALRPLRPLLRSSWTPARRTYASQTPGNPVLEIFNRKTKQLQKDRAAQNVEESRKVDYLKDEVALRLCERLLDIKRTFPNVLDLGANSCNIARALTTPIPNLDPETGAETGDATTLSDRIGNLTCVETSPALLNRDAELPFNRHLSIFREVIPNLESLPYQPNTFDAVLSSLSLHWINDLPSLLAQVNSILKPDCPFIAAMFGGDTLFELRTSLQLADLERRGGVSPHVSPLADVRDRTLWSSFRIRLRSWRTYRLWGRTMRSCRGRLDRSQGMYCWLMRLSIGNCTKKKKVAVSPRHSG